MLVQHPRAVVVAGHRHRLAPADLVDRRALQRRVAALAQRLAILFATAAGQLRGQEQGGLVDIAERRCALLDVDVGKGQRQAGRHHQVAGVAQRAGVHVARVLVGREKHLVRKAVVQRLHHQQLVVHVVGQDADGGNRPVLLAGAGLAGLQLDRQPAQVVQLVAGLRPFDRRATAAVLVLAGSWFVGAGVQRGGAVQPAKEVVRLEDQLATRRVARRALQPELQLSHQRLRVQRIPLGHQHHPLLVALGQAQFELGDQAAQHRIVGRDGAAVVHHAAGGQAVDAGELLADEGPGIELGGLLRDRQRGQRRGGGGVEQLGAGQLDIALAHHLGHGGAARGVGRAAGGRLAAVSGALKIDQRGAQAVGAGRPDQRQMRQVDNRAR